MFQTFSNNELCQVHKHSWRPLRGECIPLLLTGLVLWVKWLLYSGGLWRFPTTLFRIQPTPPLEHSGAFSLVILQSPYTKHELSIPCSGWLLPHEVKVIRDSSVFVSSLYKIPLLLLAVGHFLFFFLSFSDLISADKSHHCIIHPALITLGHHWFLSVSQIRKAE